jgi:hypothetical protein
MVGIDRTEKNSLFNSASLDADFRNSRLVGYRFLTDQVKKDFKTAP